MKKFISMVMAAAMVVSLVPATAFAATGTVEADRATVVDALDLVEDFANDMGTDATNDDVEGFIDAASAPEVMIRLDEAESADGNIKQEIKVKLDGAKWATVYGDKVETAEEIMQKAPYNMSAEAADEVIRGSFEDLLILESDLDDILDVAVDKWSNTSVTYVLTNAEGKTAVDLKEAIDAGRDTITIDLQVLMNKTNAGAQAKVTVTSDIKGAELTDKVFATVEGKGITAELDDEVKDVAPEEIVAIDPIEVEPSVGDSFNDVMKATDKVKLTLSKGFEFDKSASAKVGGVTVTNAMYTDDDEITLEASDITFLGSDLVVIEGIKIEAASAKAGDEATLTIKFGGNDTVKVVVAKVVESGLVISVDEDEDVPVMWSGVDYENTGLTADADEHVALEVTIEETFEGSYNDKDEIELTLPEGVYVVGFNPTTEDVTATAGTMTEAFEIAYNEGEYKSFIFEKRAFVETEPGDDVIEMAFELTLVADPGFVGEVPMTMLVDGEEVGTVVIAKFETPMVIEAQQNDLKIDYRNTEVGSDIVIKEAEAGLWKKGTSVTLEVEKMEFESDATFTVNEDDSDMEIKDSTKDGTLGFTVKVESDDEPAVVTISDMELYMGRSLAAGAYDLVMTSNTCVASYLSDVLFGAEVCDDVYDPETDEWFNTDHEFVGPAGHREHDKDCFVGDVSDYSDVVKEGFVNIVTAGREQDDASFTTKVVVPVGESYIVAGEQTVALDVPAYVSEAGYTMLPVRAVAVALGINTNNVLWDQATKTVTILYGQRIITMTVGAKVINVNGSAIPASASVEVVNGRTFLPMRDLATALGVTDITWDAATKTATLNGNV